MFKTDTILISPEMLSLIAEIDEFKGAWKALGNISPDRLSALRKVATIESIGSSTRIEGSNLSDREVRQLLVNLEIKTFDSRDEQEVAGYSEVMETVHEAWRDLPVTENHVRQLHRDLLRYSTKDEWHRGNYKTSSNSVAAFDSEGNQIGIVFETATPFDTPKLMSELFEWYQTRIGDGSLHPLLVIGIFVVILLEIHPFQDGNGRLSRVVTTLLLLRSGYGYVPFSSLESIIEQNKEAYYMALRETQPTIRSDKPDWSPWLLFFIRSLQKQKAGLQKKIDYEQKLLLTLPELSIQILNHVKEHGRITMNEAITLTGSNRNTLKVHFRNLQEKGQLKLNGSGRGAWYGLS